MYLFADDTKLFREIKSNSDHNILQEDVNNLLEWSEQWLLKFHPDKCVFMNISNENKQTQNTYTMRELNLNESKSEKDIGVCIDSS